MVNFSNRDPGHWGTLISPAQSSILFCCGLTECQASSCSFSGPCGECGKCEFYHRLDLLRRRLSVNSSRGEEDPERGVPERL